MAATELRTFEVLVPAGTLASAPQTTDLTMPPRIMERLEVRIPPGPNGSVGWAFTSKGARVFPFAPSTWVVANDETIPVPVDGAPETGAWQLQAYNTGRWDHTLYVRAWLRSPSERGAPVLTELLDLEALP
jgi:hypothetical protein